LQLPVALGKILTKKGKTGGGGGGKKTTDSHCTQKVKDWKLQEKIKNPLGKKKETRLGGEDVSRGKPMGHGKGGQKKPQQK